MTQKVFPSSKKSFFWEKTNSFAILGTFGEIEFCAFLYLSGDKFSLCAEGILFSLFSARWFYGIKKLQEKKLEYFKFSFEPNSQHSIPETFFNEKKYKFLWTMPFFWIVLSVLDAGKTSFFLCMLETKKKVFRTTFKEFTFQIHNTINDFVSLCFP